MHVCLYDIFAKGHLIISHHPQITFIKHHIDTPPPRQAIARRRRADRCIAKDAAPEGFVPGMYVSTRTPLLPTPPTSNITMQTNTYPASRDGNSCGALSMCDSIFACRLAAYGWENETHNYTPSQIYICAIPSGCDIWTNIHQHRFSISHQQEVQLNSARKSQCGECDDMMMKETDAVCRHLLKH